MLSHQDSEKRRALLSYAMSTLRIVSKSTPEPD